MRRGLIAAALVGVAASSFSPAYPSHAPRSMKYRGIPGCVDIGKGRMRASKSHRRKARAKLLAWKGKN